MTASIEIGGVVIACAVIDRLFVRYKQLIFDSVGDYTIDQESQVIKFPCHFVNQSTSGVQGAILQTALVDDSEPRNVVTGKKLTLNFLQLGSNDIYVSIPIKSLKAGNWEFQAVLTHGDSRFNPLYRIFPLRTVIKKTIVIDERALKHG